jgi:hypothetical protein
VRALQSEQSPAASPKGTALIVLCLRTFGLAMSRPHLWPCILLADWFRLMNAVATTFSDEKARRAIECSTWLLQKLDHFDDTESPGLAVFAPLQVALLNALQENLACPEKYGIIGSSTTSLLARFFLVFDKLKHKVVERFCRANVERMWETNCVLIAKKGDVLQASPPIRNQSLLFLLCLEVVFDSSNHPEIVRFQNSMSRCRIRQLWKQLLSCLRMLSAAPQRSAPISVSVTPFPRPALRCPKEIARHCFVQVRIPTRPIDAGRYRNFGACRPWRPGTAARKAVRSTGNLIPAACLEAQCSSPDTSTSKSLPSTPEAAPLPPWASWMQIQRASMTARSRVWPWQ